MTKYTRHQYREDIAANDAAMAAVAGELAGYAARAEAGATIASDLLGGWNDAHDREYDLECARSLIEYRWATKNWTWQDNMHADLVSKNVD